jgi:DNA transformation protein and related proteins
MAESDFHDYLISDVFSGIDGITSRKMFGGFGFYRDGIFFALLFNDQLYFKVGEGNKKEYEDLGSQPFKYYKKNKEITLSFWEVPVDVLEDKVEKSVLEAEKT